MIRPRIGLLVPYVSFYEAIVPLREEKVLFARSVAGRLREEFDVIDAGLISTEAEAASAGERFGAGRVDAVVVAPAVATFGALPWTALRGLSVPVCLWHIQPDKRIDPDHDIPKLIRNSGGLGVQALANTLMREGRFFRAGFSGLDDPLPGRLRVMIESAAVWNSLRRARFGRIGEVFEEMTDIALDASKWPGGLIADVPAMEIAEAFERQPADAVTGRVAEIRGLHRVLELTEDELSRSSRLSLAIDAIVSRHCLDGGSFNCHGANCLQNPAIGVTACYGVSRQTSYGRPFTCTGDLPTAIAMKILQDLSGWVLYAELDFIDRESGAVLLANGGEGNFGGPIGHVEITANENFKGKCGRGASLRFETFRGPATMLSFTPKTCTGGYRMVAAEGMLDQAPPSRLGVFHGAFRFKGNSATDVYESWCEAGAVHHLALAPGHWLAHLQELAVQSGFELVVAGGVRRCD